jgi:hypothetical protein
VLIPSNPSNEYILPVGMPVSSAYTVTKSTATPAAGAIKISLHFTSNSIEEFLLKYSQFPDPDALLVNPSVVAWVCPYGTKLMIALFEESSLDTITFLVTEGNRNQEDDPIVADVTVPLRYGWPDT